MSAGAWPSVDGAHGQLLTPALNDEILAIGPDRYLRERRARVRGKVR
jgi:hypothetical protein